MTSEADVTSGHPLFEAPSPAVLATYRRDGSAALSPVWFREYRGMLEVVIAENDVKLRHLAANPTCTLLIFEVETPFRGVRVEGTPELMSDGVASARAEIAARYLGAEDGERFASSRSASGVVLRLPVAAAKSWDLANALPSRVSHLSADPAAPDRAVAAALAELPDWRIEKPGIAATFATGSFSRGVTLIDAIGALADAANHHPDIELGYPRVTVRLVTHDAGSRVTGRDTALAAKISAAAAALGIGSTDT